MTYDLALTKAVRHKAYKRRVVRVRRTFLLLSFFLYSLYPLLLRGPAFLTQQLRSLRSVVLPDVSGAPAAVGTVSHAQRSRRITFLFVVAVTQVLYMGVLVRV